MYKVNVARFGHHMFVAECIGASREKAERIYKMICARFPEPEFSVELTLWQTTGERILDRPLAVPRRNSNEV